jgi:peptide/nickel transport system substrate-binding protein
VAYIYYTNQDSLIADLKSGNVDATDQVPFNAIKPLESASNVAIDNFTYGELTNITWNSNPHKTKNRELLDPRVKEALSMCVDRQQIIDVVFSGHASTVESLLGQIAGDWQNPDVKPLEHDCAKGNQILDQLGYKRGANGIRMAPATANQPAHPMQYEIMVPGSLDFNGDRTFSIVQQGLEQAGVKTTELAGGDSTASYAIETGPKCDPKTNTGYDSFDIALWDWVAAPDPDFQLSVVTKAQWCSWSDTGWDNPAYDKMYQEQATLVDKADRMALVHKMDKIIHDNWLYTQLVNEDGIAAHSKKWAGWDPSLSGASPMYFALPHEVG